MGVRKKWKAADQYPGAQPAMGYSRPWLHARLPEVEQWAPENRRPRFRGENMFVDW